jgi:formate hydrogenlyase subunit 4
MSSVLSNFFVQFGQNSLCNMFTVTYSVVVSFMKIGIVKVLLLILSTLVAKLSVRNLHKLLMSICERHED